MNLEDAPLLIVALLVFAGIFVYTWSLDSKTRRLERELREDLEERADTPGIIKREELK